jgi:hypothetical protein
MRGSLHSAADDKTVLRFGRDDAFWEDAILAGSLHSAADDETVLCFSRDDALWGDAILWIPLKYARGRGNGRLGYWSGSRASAMA